MGSGYIVQRGGGKDYSAFKARADGSLTEVTAEMLDGATSIALGAFYACSSLKNVDISNSVTSIDSSAFNGCSALTSIDIPSGVTSIGANVLNFCTSLISITVEATTPPTLGYAALDGTHANLVIYVPSESVNAYKTAKNWSKYASKIQAIP